MTQINIIGPCFGFSGYDIHCRNLANALNKITKVRLSTGLPQGFETMANDQEIEMLKRKQENDEINLIITNPVYWRVNCQAKRNWVYLVWEGDKIPKSFMEECLNPNIEKIIVPSRHTAEAIRRTFEEYDPDAYLEVGDEAGRNKIVVIPHGVDLGIFKELEKPKEKFTFVANKGFRNVQDRGGMQYLFKAFIEEFTDKENVRLLAKINPVYGVPNIEEMIKKITEKREEIPEMTITSELFKYEDMVNFYNQGHVFVSPTRAEAFNIPCLEAMACGLPVITTNFGGQTDYVNEKNGWLIGGELTEVNWEINYEGIKWLTPDVAELRRILREVYNNGMQGIEERRKEALKTAQKMTWNETARKIADLI